MQPKLILTVCRGNIVRSAVTEALIRRGLQKRGLSTGFTVTSRGVQGTPVDPEPVKFSNIRHYSGLRREVVPILEEIGVDLRGHSARTIDRAIVDRASVILVADRKICHGVVELFPEAAPKVHLLSELLGSTADIADPDQTTGPDVQRSIILQIQQAVEQGFDRLLQLVA